MKARPHAASPVLQGALLALLALSAPAAPVVRDDTASIEARLKSADVHVAIGDAWQYLELDRTPTHDPVFFIRERGQLRRRFLLLARRGAGFDALEGLRGKPLLRQEIAAGDIARAWLRLLLLDRRLGTSEDFSSKVTSTSRPTSAILPVFFGNAAACIADEHSFALMSELNPAVGKQLQIIAASDVFADVVVCLSKSGWIAPTDRAATELSLRELHADPAGQQICTLFKFERMVPFDPAHLESVRRLRSDCRRRSKEGSP